MPGNQSCKARGFSLLEKAIGYEYNQFKREVMWAATSKVKGPGLLLASGTHMSGLCVLDVKHEFNVYSAGFWSCFSLIPFYRPIPPFWNGNVYYMPLYVRNI